MQTSKDLQVHMPFLHRRLNIDINVSFPARMQEITSEEAWLASSSHHTAL
jgi:hypothetical protein